jgi:hypothetical protein
MVLAPSAVEDGSKVGDGMRVRYLASLVLPALLTVWAGPPLQADEMTDLVAPYLAARDQGRVGDVVLHALGDPPRPSAPAIPYQGVSVMLLPRSVPFESEVDGIKEHLRDSLKSYMAAADDVMDARTAYETALLWVGGGELVQGEVSDAGGLARLMGVPAGEWVLMAWREETHPMKPPRLRAKEAKGFRDIPVTAGHSVVTYWWMRLQVRAGETTSVELNDRNVWIAAVRENVFLMEGPAARTAPSRGGR